MAALPFMATAIKGQNSSDLKESSQAVVRLSIEGVVYVHPL
jgi:hypothetical protein